MGVAKNDLLFSHTLICMNFFVNIFYSKLFTKIYDVEGKSKAERLLVGYVLEQSVLVSYQINPKLDKRSLDTMNDEKSSKDFFGNFMSMATNNQ